MTWNGCSEDIIYKVLHDGWDQISQNIIDNNILNKPSFRKFDDVNLIVIMI